MATLGATACSALPVPRTSPRALERAHRKFGRTSRPRSSSISGARDVVELLDDVSRGRQDGGALPVEGLRVESDTVSVRTRDQKGVSLQLALDDALLVGWFRVTEGDSACWPWPRTSDASATERLTRWGWMRRALRSTLGAGAL